ncbi:Serine protease snake, partial [Harpegnathos saltator]
ECAESAEAVFGIAIPPTLLLGQRPVNISRCALSTRKWIVGSRKAQPKEFPHMTAIGFQNTENEILWLCAGSLISDRVILTVAHCTDSNWGAPKWARVGDLNLAQTNDDARPQTIKIVEIISHPDYKQPSVYHDIAIMKLETPVTYTAWARPACLPVDLPDIDNDGKAVATGWGRFDWTDDKYSDDLLKVMLSLVPQQSCNESFFEDGNTQLKRGIVDEWQICAGEEGRDACEVNSGGPLTVFNTNHDCMYNIIGIASIGRLCGSIIPGVYTRVYHYIPWIERVAWPEYFKNNQDT